MTPTKQIGLKRNRTFSFVVAEIVADITTWKVYIINMNNKNPQRDDTNTGNLEGYPVPPLEAQFRGGSRISSLGGRT